MKALETATGRDLVTLYRMRRALLDGVGISDKNKKLLMGATQGSDHAITWDDFRPQDLADVSPLAEAAQ